MRHRRRLRADLAPTDQAFDQLLPIELRRLSQTHWTPFEVVVKAVSLLNPLRGTRVLDVGAGIGKVCSIGAMATTAYWCGIEQHETLVDNARRLAHRLGVASRTMFVHGDAFAIDWRDFDALYLYNPFELPLFADTALPPFEHALQIARVQHRLAGLDAGTRVVTLHGFGGVMPSSFELLYHERMPVVGLDLVLWMQRSRRGREPT